MLSSMSSSPAIHGMGQKRKGKERKEDWREGKKGKEKEEREGRLAYLAGQLPCCLPCTRYCSLTLGLSNANADVVYQQAVRTTQALEPFGQCWTVLLLENYGGTESSF